MGMSNFVNGMFKRGQVRNANLLGVIPYGKTVQEDRFRSAKLEVLDAYYENRQYCHLVNWDQAKDSNGQHIPIRMRQPKIKFAFAKTFSQRLAAKLIGKTVFPQFLVPDSPDDQEFIQAIIRESKLKAHIIEPVRRMLATGSVLLRFYLQGGALKIEWYASKHCYPEFQENGELEKVRIQYTYEDKDDLNSKGEPKVKWYRLDLEMLREVEFDNPEYRENQEPVFQEVSSVNHGLGFVQAEWLKTAEIHESPDGYSVTEDILEFIDELNYSLSQSSTAVSYNQDPQLVFKKIDEEELESVVRSSQKSWNLGQNGEAEFLESGLSGVQMAMELRDKVRLNIQDIARVLLLDPEKIVGSAQSAKAMEVLYGPMMDLIDELRPWLDESLKKFVLKMGLATLIANRQGIPVPLEIPPGYVPQNLNIETEWPPIFQQTMEDLQKKVGIASSAKNGGLIAPATATKFVAKDFGVEDIEAEVKAVADAQAAMAALNPFGGF